MSFIDILMISSLLQMLYEANDFHPNIKLVHQIGTLTTSVYHKEAAEPYIVPFKSDHPRYVFN